MFGLLAAMQIHLACWQQYICCRKLNMFGLLAAMQMRRSTHEVLPILKGTGLILVTARTPLELRLADGECGLRRLPLNCGLVSLPRTLHSTKVTANSRAQHIIAVLQAVHYQYQQQLLWTWHWKQKEKN